MAGGAFCSLIVAALVGAVLPPPAPFENIPILDGLTTAALLVFAWAVFHLVRPATYSRKWAIAEVIVIPAFWGLLVGALAVWFCGLNTTWHIDYERSMEFIPPIL